MGYLLARNNLGLGCLAIKCDPGHRLVALKREIIQRIGYGPVELITISRPVAYLEYAPYAILDTEDEFIRAVMELYETTKEEPQ